MILMKINFLHEGAHLFTGESTKESLCNFHIIYIVLGIRLRIIWEWKNLPKRKKDGKSLKIKGNFNNVLKIAVKGNPKSQKNKKRKGD